MTGELRLNMKNIAERPGVKIEAAGCAASVHQQHQRLSNILASSVTWTGRDICPYTSINSGHISLFTLTSPRHHQKICKTSCTKLWVKQTFCTSLFCLFQKYFHIMGRNPPLLPSSNNISKKLSKTSRRGSFKLWFLCCSGSDMRFEEKKTSTSGRIFFLNWLETNLSWLFANTFGPSDHRRADSEHNQPTH